MRAALFFASAFFHTAHGVAKYARYCDAPIDVLFLQDTTESFGPFLSTVTNLLPSLIQSVLDTSPNSKFGAAEYRDRPYWALGFQDDTCYTLMTPLDQNITRVQNAYASMEGQSGADTKEGHYFAIVNAVYDPAVGWEPSPARSRLIIMSTDASPHLPNDYITYTASDWAATAWNQRQMPDFFPEHPGRPVNTDNFTEDCMTYDYPSYTQVKEALEDQETYLAILIPSNIKQVYSDWYWVNHDLLGQDDSFLNFVEMDGKGFSEAVSQVVRHILEDECIDPPAPTTEPTTSTTAKPHTTTVASTQVPTRKPEGGEDTDICNDLCDCWKCTFPKSFLRFEETPTSYHVKVRY